MRNKLLILFILFSTDSYSQFWNWSDTTLRNSISFRADYFYQSNAISNNFANDYYSGIFLTDKLKNDVLNNAPDINRFGAEYNVGLNYRLALDNSFAENSFLEFDLSDHFHIDCSFTDDLFSIYFKGNKDYENKKANLAPFKYNQLSYQQFKISYGHFFNLEDQKIFYKFGLSLNKGSKFLNFHSNEATLFTALEGDYLDLKADLAIRLNDSAKTGLTAWNGTGTSAFLELSSVDKSKNVWRVAFDNFGFITWNSKSTLVSTDTSFRFTGIDVSEIFNFADTITNNISLDSAIVQPFLDNRKTESFTTPLPGRITASFTTAIARSWRVEIALQQLFFANYITSIQSTFYHDINKNHSASISLRTGGYGNFIAGVGYNFQLNNYRLAIYSDYLSALISPNGKAQGISLSFTKLF